MHSVRISYLFKGSEVGYHLMKYILTDHIWVKELEYAKVPALTQP